MLAAPTHIRSPHSPYPLQIAHYEVALLPSNVYPPLVNLFALETKTSYLGLAIFTAGEAGYS